VDGLWWEGETGENGRLWFAFAVAGKMTNTEARQTTARFATVSYPVVRSKAAETLAPEDRLIEDRIEALTRKGRSSTRRWRLGFTSCHTWELSYRS
jgi:hypothetical protein